MALAPIMRTCSSPVDGSVELEFEAYHFGIHLLKLCWRARLAAVALDGIVVACVWLLKPCRGLAEDHLRLIAGVLAASGCIVRPLYDVCMYVRREGSFCNLGRDSLPCSGMFGSCGASS